MTDFDTRIRALSNALTQDAPAPPSIDELRVPVEMVEIRRRRPSSRVLVAAAIVIVIVATAGLVALVRADDPAQPASGEVCLPDPGFFTGSNGQTFGPISRNNESAGPDDSPGSPIVAEEIPDFVRVTCVNSDGVIGWVRKADLLPQLSGPPIESVSSGDPRTTAMCDREGNEVGSTRTTPRYPVFEADGSTVIGHIYPLLGYFAVGEEPQYYPDRNGWRPCDGDFTALPMHPATAPAQLARPGAVNDAATYSDPVSFPDDNGDGIIGYADDYERAKYMAQADQARMMNAERAKAMGTRYNPIDLFPPLRDEAGRIVGYLPMAAGRLVTFAELSDPSFDLCSRQVETLRRQQQLLREDPSLLGEGLTDEMRQQLLDRDPRQGVGC